jgi:HAD superfamily hydrolase (TIGR01549 family)
MKPVRAKTADTGLPFKAILFDWAWTLVDLDIEDDCRPLKKVYEFLQQKDVALPDFDACLQTSRKVFGEMIELSRRTQREACFEHALSYLLLHQSIKIAGKTTVREILSVYYKEVYAVRKVFSDVVPALDQLRARGFRLGIISNTTNPGFMKDYERQSLGLDSYFECAVYSSEVPYRKPHPSIFNLGARFLRLENKEILYVGDNIEIDVVGAQKAGMTAAWLNRDGESRSQGIVPEYEISDLSQLLSLAPAQV